MSVIIDICDFSNAGARPVYSIPSFIMDNLHHLSVLRQIWLAHRLYKRYLVLSEPVHSANVHGRVVVVVAHCNSIWGRTKLVQYA